MFKFHIFSISHLSLFRKNSDNLQNEKTTFKKYCLIKNILQNRKITNKIYYKNNLQKEFSP